MAFPEDRRHMVGERLAELREQKALTLRELEEASGIGADAISKIENGHRKPRPSTLRKLARALGIEVEDFFREPALPLDEAPRGTGQAEASTQTDEEFERRLGHVLEPVRADALRDAQATSRLFASEGIPQTTIGDIPEAETGDRFVHEFSPEERSLAFGEVALGYARLERAKANLEANYTHAQGMLRERNDKIGDLEAKLERLQQEIAKLKEGDKRMRQENARLRQDLAEYRAEAEREQEPAQ
jgi:transcriptional regulator with XRE-family HTH domain